MEEKIKLLKADLGDNRIKVEVDITDYLETKLGGRVKAFYIATTSRELVRIIELCQELKIPYQIIGSGSKFALGNLGFSGLVIKNRSNDIKIYGIKGKVSREGIGIEEAMVEADSGVSLEKLADFAGKQKLGGFEVLQDTMGTVGGSLSINKVLQDKCFQVKILPENGEIESVNTFAVRKNDAIISVVFKLKAKKV